MGKPWIAALLISVNLLLVSISDFAYAKSEADWFYEAAQLEARFEKISSAQIPPNQKMEEYFALLDDVTKFGTVAGESERATRGRKAFALLATGWIQQMLANTEAANKAQAEYKKLVESMPEDEQAIARCFLERDYQKSPVSMPRVCNVEGRGKELRVTAVDWPIRDLLQKIADAAGEKIQLPEELYGTSDCVQAKFERVDGFLSAVAPAWGLYAPGGFGKPLRITIGDPMYSASLGERASQTPPPLGEVVVPRAGINTGFVIVGGMYLPPPYQVEARLTQTNCGVYINNLPVGENYNLDFQGKPTMQLPPSGRFSEERKSDAAVYAFERYVVIWRESGQDKAEKWVRGFLLGQGYVKTLDFANQGLLITVHFADGTKHVCELPYAPGPDNILGLPSTHPRAIEQRRKAWDAAKLELAELVNRSKLNVEKTLGGGGLVIGTVKARRLLRLYPKEEGTKKIMQIVSSLQETNRREHELCRQLFGSNVEGFNWSWEIFLNVRCAELARRLSEAASR